MGGDNRKVYLSTVYAHVARVLIIHIASRAK